MGAGLTGAAFGKLLTFTECIQCAGQGAKSFRGIVSSQSSNNTFEVETYHRPCTDTKVMFKG